MKIIVGLLPKVYSFYKLLLFLSKLFYISKKTVSCNWNTYVHSHLTGFGKIGVGCLSLQGKVPSFAFWVMYGDEHNSDSNYNRCNDPFWTIFDFYIPGLLIYHSSGLNMLGNQGSSHWPNCYC